LSEMMEALKAASPTDRRTKEMLEEWDEFFVDGIFGGVLARTLQLCTDVKSEPSLDTYVAERMRGPSLLTSLGRMVKLIPDHLLTDHALQAKFHPEDVDASVLPDKVVFLLNHFCPLMTSTSQQASSIAFNLLVRVMAHVAKYESSKETGDDDDYSAAEAAGEPRPFKALPRRLADILVKTEPLVEAFLDEFGFDFGESLPLTSSGVIANAQLNNMVKSYLMSWRLVLEVVAGAGDATRMKYSDCFRDNTKLLIRVLFHLLPHKKLVSSSSAGAGETTDSLRDLASSCLYCLMRHLPALVRSQWGQMDRKGATAVIDRFTAANVTPVLWQEAVDRIKSRKDDFGDKMTVKVRPNVREVVASYNFSDEGYGELVIQLPANFPLGSVQVESINKVGVAHAQWRNLMLQLTTFLMHQNGSIVDGLAVWKRNIDKRFEGVEECYICFFVLHGTNHQLPKAACRTCKKKFHGACLYKWFQTSNNSTCPLCRNLF